MKIMSKFKFVSEDSLSVAYQYKTDYDEIFLMFNKYANTVSISQSRFICKEGMMVPQNGEDDQNRHSCKYGHWQAEMPCLSVEDIEFIDRKCKEIFGRGES